MNVASFLLFSFGLIIPILAIGLVGANSAEIAGKIRGGNYGKHVKLFSGAVMILAAILLISL